MVISMVMIASWLCPSEKSDICVLSSYITEEIKSEKKRRKKTLQSPLITVVHLTAVCLKVLELGCMLYLSVAPGEFSFSNSCKYMFVHRNNGFNLA